MTRTPDHIMADLSRKCADDVGDRILMTARLVDDPADALMIALSACGVAIGTAAGFADVRLADRGAPQMTAEQKVALIWSILEPLALKATGGDGEPFNQLLKRCRA